jgi:hypothetical protein
LQPGLKRVTRCSESGAGRFDLARLTLLGLICNMINFFRSPKHPDSEDELAKNPRNELSTVRSKLKAQLGIYGIWNESKSQRARAAQRRANEAMRRSVHMST